MKSFIVIVVHNRHTDDRFYVFPNTEAGKKEADKFFESEKIKRFPVSGGGPVGCYGDDSWGYDEDYAMYMDESSN